MRGILLLDQRWQPVAQEFVRVPVVLVRQSQRSAFRDRYRDMHRAIALETSPRPGAIARHRSGFTSLTHPRTKSPTSCSGLVASVADQYSGRGQSAVGNVNRSSQTTGCKTSVSCAPQWVWVRTRLR